MNATTSSWQIMRFSIAICAFIIELSFPADAQQSRTLATIGMVGARSGVALFQRELRELGYVEGKNIAYEYRQSDGNLKRLPSLVDELIRLKVDVLVASSTPAAIASKNATTTIPIVFLTVPDPVRGWSREQSGTARQKHNRSYKHYSRVSRQTAGVA
jgi:ABC-type uncharacterized transport system substrate-binding protein